MRTIPIRTAILVTLLVTGCTYTAELNRSPYVNQAALDSVVSEGTKKSPEEIVFLKKPPTDKAFVVLGTLHAPKTGWTAHYTNDDLIKAMRVKAAELGGDAIVDFRTQENPTVVQQGYWDAASGTGQMTGVRHKGLHAWGEVIRYVSAEERERIEPGQQ